MSFVRSVRQLPQRLGFYLLSDLSLSMKNQIFLMLMLLSTATFAVSQAYVQTVDRDGSSVMVRELDTSMFAALLKPDALGNMALMCKAGFQDGCAVDTAAGTINTTVKLSQADGYYTFTTDYGFPFVTHTLTVYRLPTDRFGEELDALLAATNASQNPPSGTRLEAIDLSADNSQLISYAKMFGVKMTYVSVMPSAVEQASSGDVAAAVTDGSASFDLIAVLATSKPIVVQSRELNYTYLVLLVALVVLAALAYSFFTAVPKGERERKSPEPAMEPKPETKVAKKKKGSK